MTDKMSTIKIKESTKELLKPYKMVYGSYENAILELIEDYENK